GGLVAGLALDLRYLAGGRYELGEAVPIDAGRILGAGLLLAAGTAAGSMAFGAPALSSATFEFALPVFGEVKLVTALLFDARVYLTVAGRALSILRGLGARRAPADRATPELRAVYADATPARPPRRCGRSRASTTPPPAPTSKRDAPRSAR